MSLHIGNLSPHIRGEHLERVFRRFGRCSIRIKDKYGFVVYDYPASAEKALKTLKGTRILGEAITLSWSKKQPHATPRFAKGRKFYDPPQRRHFAKENADRRLGSNERRDYHGMDIQKEADGEVRKVGSSDLVDESISHPEDSKHHVGGENKLEDDRWEEQVVGRSNEKYLENSMDFDRYDPYHGKKELDEDERISLLGGSPSIRKLQERTRDRYNQESQRTCYLCGEEGHKMSKCPLQINRHVSRSREVEPSSSRNSKKFLGHGDSPARQINSRGRSKEFRDRKGNWSDYESRDKNHLERGRGPSSSSVLSECTSSRSQSPSRSVRSLSRSTSPTKTKSVPSKKISLPSSLRSSPSCHSMSRSTLPTSLSPIELNRHLSPSPSKRQKGFKSSVANDAHLAHNTDLFAEETPVRSGGVLKSEKTTSAVEKKCESRLAEFEQEDMKKDPPEKNIEHCDVVNEDVVEELISVSESNIDSTANGSNPARMSLEETCMVLKHYGLQCPDKIEKDLPVETYFGSARLWPWEIIYYRRLKKGPISAENYSRRIAQNQEFGIVDKYIRSSSGWGEPNQNNP